ncbi:hypothetical protein AB6806_08935 [Bosea sp. RCC_152_1]|uniref:hypothetical protein n=1 Tax=Bosea sp. RCC_152_1 TaxID=3239228 RepID=UPI003524FE8F
MSELGLWRAVISQALADACPKFRTTNAPSINPWLHERDRSRAWLIGMSSDFISVCHLAGFEPQAVQALAHQKIAAFDAANPDIAAMKVTPRARRQRNRKDHRARTKVENEKTTGGSSVAA